jgi:[ribosomal protein S5]-alanine N-acetyltransferase
MSSPVRSFLRGPRVHLRALVEADVEGEYPHWFNDEEVCRGNSHHVFPYTRAAALEYVRQVGSRRDDLVLAVALNEDGRHIGNIALAGIHPLYRTAELSIVMGDRTIWGNGYSKEAGHLLVAHGFAALNLHRIGCGTFADNIAMQRLARALGMKEEGRRREAAFKDGRYVDVLEYGVLAADYAALLAARPTT